MAKKKKADRPLCTRGYSELLEQQKKKSRYIKHCNSCASYYADKGETEEYCQNNNVLPYDVVQDGSNIFCHYWKPCEPKDLEVETEEENDYLARFKKKIRK